MAVQIDAGTYPGTSMKVVFRADASLHIGTGHVMRCLTLADALEARGAHCQFICRAHEGNLIDHIRQKGYHVDVLPLLALKPPLADNACVVGADAVPSSPANAQPVHSHWLGATQVQDAQACSPILAVQQPDWLIVDHYALDARWEHALAPHYHQLMVIDDLADRLHACDLLLDQTFGRDAADYRTLVPAQCHLLCGSSYALLRPEFAALRAYSLQRRAQPQLRSLLITMGGVDKDNVTSKVLIALCASPLPSDCQITVVMGSTAPWLAQVRQLTQDMPWSTQVLVGVSNMAQLMADSDLAIGAAGATSWERCCLGLPTIMLVLASNQQQVAQALERGEAARIIRHTQDIALHLPVLLRELFEQPTVIQAMSQCAAKIVDGQGLSNIIHMLES